MQNPRRVIPLVIAPLVIALLLGLLPAAAAADEPACPYPAGLPPTPFEDLVSATHHRSIVCSAWYDLVRGIDGRRFAPLAPVRRDQMAAFLVRALVLARVPLPSEPPQQFEDVAASAHRDAIAQVAELGLVEGTGARTYAPGEAVTRAQMAAFLVRLTALLDITATGAGDAFDDDGGSVHHDAINRAAALGLARGTSATTFAPGRAIRREQMASFLARLVTLMVDRGAVARRPIPAFTSNARPLPPQMRGAMRGATWRPGCPVGLDHLVLLEVTHWDFRARPRRGHLVVARSAADDLATVFRRIYRARFQIERMRPVHTYEGGELASLNDNNTSAFDCRAVTGGSSWSEHSYGTAIDINPRQNPYVKGSVVLPANGRPWLDRTPARRGMITPSGPVATAFAAIGWGWGGDYRTLKDYQHFSASGR